MFDNLKLKAAETEYEEAEKRNATLKAEVTQLEAELAQLTIEAAKKFGTPELEALAERHRSIEGRLGLLKSMQLGTTSAQREKVGQLYAKKAEGLATELAKAEKALLEETARARAAIASRVEEVQRLVGELDQANQRRCAFLGRPQDYMAELSPWRHVGPQKALSTAAAVLEHKEAWA